MKKISFILLALLCWSSMVSAQENNNRLRKKYRNLSFVKQEFEPASYFGNSAKQVDVKVDGGSAEFILDSVGALLFAACGNTNKEADKKEDLTIVTTFYPIYQSKCRQ